MTYPTEDAYLRVCRALHWHTAQLRAHGIEPDPIAPDAPHYPPDDHVFTSAPRHTVVISARQQGKTHKLACDRVRKVAKGATINGTYKLAPEPALDAFRADLLRIVGE